MHKKLFSIFSALLIAIFITSTVSAGPGVKFSRNVDFSLGSLIANGSLFRYGNLDMIVYLSASGDPLVTCTNQGGNQAPGQNPPKVSAAGEQSLPKDGETTKNGKASFSVETVDPQFVDALVFGCPNDNWTAEIDFIFWTDATITITDLSGNVLLTQDYTCDTTINSVSCTPVE